MKKWLLILVVALVFTLATVSAVGASSDPVGGCPDGFQLHQMTLHDHHDMAQHKHVGNDRDLNGDNWICGKHVGVDGTVHVHIDNNVARP